MTGVVSNACSKDHRTPDKQQSHSASAMRTGSGCNQTACLLEAIHAASRIMHETAQSIGDTAIT